MKLLRLKLNTEFRSLQAGFEVNFLQDISQSNQWSFMPYCIVGRNGSGKSNILEALAAIFYHVECMHLETKPDSFEATMPLERGFKREVCYPDAFELEYISPVDADFSDDFSSDFTTVNEAHILIYKKVKEAPKVFWLNKSESENKNQELTGIEIKKILPEYVIGYSSGENEILSLPFFKMRFIQYDEYLERLIKDLDYTKPESRLVYLDESFNQAIVLSLFLINEGGENRNNIESLYPFIKEIGVQDIQFFRIIIRKHHYETIHDDLFRTYNEHDRKDEKKLKRELTSKLHYAIEKLKRCSTTQFYDSETDELYLDYFIDKEIKKAFKLTFGTALELFQTFQILLTLNLYQVKKELKKKIYHSPNIFLSKDVVPVPYNEDRIFRFKDVVLKKKEVDSVIFTKSLSDGEFQLLHAIGLCLIFKNTNSLFLLDEPETHFNPDWRAKFISTLRDCLVADKNNKAFMRDLLITSHSPFIVSDCHQDNVLVFKKGLQNGVVTAERPDFNTFGASVNLITIKLFNRIDTIGDLANEKIIEYEKIIQKGEDLEKIKNEIFNTLGDSVERTILINQLIQKSNKP